MYSDDDIQRTGFSTPRDFRLRLTKQALVALYGETGMATVPPSNRNEAVNQWLRDHGHLTVSVGTIRRALRELNATGRNLSAVSAVVA